MSGLIRDEIIRMAREARLAEHTHPYQLWSASDDGLERFAALVAAAERERIAKQFDSGLVNVRARGQE